MTQLKKCFSTKMLTVISALLLLTSCGGGGEEENANVLQANAYLQVAELYRSQGQFRASLIEAQNALQALPGHEPTRRLIAKVYLDMGDIAAAREILQALNEETPDNNETVLLLAEAMLRTGNADSVHTLLNGFIPENEAQQVQMHWLSGSAYARSNDAAAAQEALRSGREIDPTHTPTLIALSILEYQSGNEFGAQELIDQAVAATPDDVDLWIWRGQLALVQEDYPRAEEAFFAALETLGDQDTMTSKRLAVLQAIIIPLQMQQKDDEALRYSQIIAESPQGQLQAAFNDALALFQEGEYQQASLAVEDVLSSAPGHVGSNILRGLSQYALGDLQSAEATLTELVNSNSSSPEIIRALAATHLRQNQPERALSVLQDAAETYADDASLLALMGLSQQALGEQESAIETLQQAIELQANSPELHYALAASLFQDQRPEAAVTELYRALEINPAFTQAKTALIDFYLNEGLSEDGLRAANQWVTDAPAGAENYYFLGRVEAQLGNLAAARAAFSEAATLDPSLSAARILLARIYVELEDYDSAQTELQSVLERNPADLQALSSILALGNLQGSEEQSVAMVEDIVAANPTLFEPSLVLAQYYLSEQDLASARTSATAAYSINVNAFTENTLLDIINRQAVIARAENDLARARELSSEALEVQPQHIPSLLMAAGIEVQAGDYPAAEVVVERIEQLQPENPALSLELKADLLVQQDRREAASDLFRQAWDANPSTNLGIKLHQNLMALSETETADAFLIEWEGAQPEDPNVNLLRAMRLQEQGQEEEAISRYESTLLSLETNLVALNNLAWLYQDSNPERAVELAERAAELYPDNADVLDTLGWILLKRNSRERAVEILERALELAPDSESIAQHLETARS